ncbi:DUF2130 domain-containing protein, partial [Streptococcus pyogenes]
MNQIKCPHCGTAFQVNETEYSELLSQVRTVEFENEIHARLSQELALVEEKAKNEQQKALEQKNLEVQALKNLIEQFETQKELVKKTAEQDMSALLTERDKE